MMSRYLAGLADRLGAAGFAGQLLLLTSKGGVMDYHVLAGAPVHAIGSGPSMAPIAGKHFAALDADADTAIVADTGGTTFDVSLVCRGAIPMTPETWLGQPQEGVELARQAMRLDPYEMDSWAHYLGRALFGARQYREAISAFKRVPLPRYSHHAFIAACHAYLGEDEDAEVERTKILRLKQEFSSGEFCKALFYGDDADQQHVRQGLVKAGLPDVANTRYDRSM